MTEDVGLIDCFACRFSELLTDPRIKMNVYGQWAEFGFEWLDGEIADPIIVAITDGYYDCDEVSYEGKKFPLIFSEEELTSVVKYLHQLPRGERPSAELSLRYYIEFDAFFDPDELRVGGKWTWGNRAFRPEKRNPEEFLQKWSRI